MTPIDRGEGGIPDFRPRQDSPKHYRKLYFSPGIRREKAAQIRTAQQRQVRYFSRTLREMEPLFDPHLSLDLLQRRAFGLRNHGLHPDKLQHHHAGKEREDVANRENGDHLREESSEQCGKDPMRAAAQALALRAMAIGKYF